MLQQSHSALDKAQYIITLRPLVGVIPNCPDYYLAGTTQHHTSRRAPSFPLPPPLPPLRDALLGEAPPARHAVQRRAVRPRSPDVHGNNLRLRNNPTDQLRVHIHLHLAFSIRLSGHLFLATPSLRRPNSNSRARRRKRPSQTNPS